MCGLRTSSGITRQLSACRLPGPQTACGWGPGLVLIRPPPGDTEAPGGQSRWPRPLPNAQPSAGTRLQKQVPLGVAAGIQGSCLPTRLRAR